MTGLIIHVGTHKTGTTAIQRFLKANRSRLQAQDVGVLGLPPAARETFFRLVKEPQDQLEPSRQIFSDLIRASISREKQRNRRGNGRYLLSWEGFSGRGGDGYVAAPAIASLIAGLKPDLDVRVLVYYRRQDDFLESMYSQLVRQGLARTFRDYVDSIPEDGFDWYRHVCAFQDQLGGENVVVSRYGRAFLPERDSLLRDFALKAGLVVDQLDYAPRPLLNKGNEGWTPELIEVARRLNALVPADQRQSMKRIFNAITTKDVYSPYVYMSACERREIVQRYRASNGLLAADRFPESWPSLFPEDDLLDREHDMASPAAALGDGGIDADVLIDIVRRIVECSDTTEWLLQQRRIDARSTPPSSAGWIGRLRQTLRRLR